MNFYRKNELLFWILGILFSILSIVYSINGNIISQYNEKPVFGKKFIINQLNLLSISKDNRFSKETIKIFGEQNNLITGSTRNNNDTLLRKLYLIDRTGSTENSLANLFNETGKWKKKKEKTHTYTYEIIDSIINIAKNYGYHYNEDKIESLSAASILTLYNILTTNKKNNEFSVLFYYGNNEFSFYNEEKDKGTLIWNKIDNEDDIQNLIDNFINKDENKIKKQTSNLEEISKKIENTKNNNGYYYIAYIFSDFEDNSGNKTNKIIKKFNNLGFVNCPLKINKKNSKNISADSIANAIKNYFILSKCNIANVNAQLEVDGSFICYNLKCQPSRNLIYSILTKPGKYKIITSDTENDEFFLGNFSNLKSRFHLPRKNISETFTIKKNDTAMFALQKNKKYFLNLISENKLFEIVSKDIFDSFSIELIIFVILILCEVFILIIFRFCIYHLIKKRNFKINKIAIIPLFFITIFSAIYFYYKNFLYYTDYHHFIYFNNLFVSVSYFLILIFVIVETLYEKGHNY